MSSSKDAKGSTGPAPGKGTPESGPKKPYATIELTASEVKEATAKAAAATASAASAATTSAASGGAATATAATAKPEPARTEAPKAESGKTEPGKTEAAKPAATAAPATGARPAADTAKTATAPAADTRAAAKPLDTRAPAATGGRGFAGFLTHLAAGIAGGFLALLGADTLGPQLGLSSVGGTRVDGVELAKRLTQLEQSSQTRIASLDATLAQKLAAAEAKLGRIDEVNRAVGSLTEAQGKLSSDAQALGERLARIGATAPPAERLQRMEQTLATLAAAAGTDGEKGRVPQLAAITGKISDLEASLANQITAVRKGIASEVETRIASVAEASEAARSGTQRIDREVAAAKTETTRIATRLDGLKTQSDKLDQQLRTMKEETGQLKSAVDGLKGDVAQQLKPLARAQDVSAAVAPLTAKLGTLESSVQSVVKSEDDRRSNAERIVLALELANLKRALDRGGPYAAELAEVKKVAGPRVDLAALDKASATGMATVSDLAAEFRGLAHRLIESEAQPAEGTVVDRLLSGAKGIVKVRKTSFSADDRSIEAVVARIEDALKGGRLVDSLGEAKALPAKAREVAAPWLAKAEARGSVDRTLQAVEAQLKASLAGKPAPKTN